VSGRVLVVEDDEANRGAVRALLEDAGYECCEAIDGEAALVSVRTAHPDLVLLDLELPGMSGAEVHRALRRDPRTRFLPTVFLSAHSGRDERLAELEAGADDYITKPYDADELLARVGAAVRRSSGLRAVNPLSGLPGNTTITEEIESSGRYQAVRPRIKNLDRRTEADEIRRVSAAPDVMLGSVHAVTETGSLITASMGGSQLGPYVSGAGRVILVVGIQKIVSDLEEGLRRVNEYAFPLEDARAQLAYGIHSAVNKVLIINREVTPGRITVVLVDEVLGF